MPTEDCEWADGFGIPSLDAPAFAMATFDDGTGEALYVGGVFTSIGGISSVGIAKWDGTAWSPVGGGTDGEVFSLQVWDDGTGEALFVGGFFSTVGAVPAENIAKWDGSTWSALGTGTDGSVDAMAVFDDGGGESLYIGGFFDEAGGVMVYSVAEWDGTAWSDLDTGMDDAVVALAVFDGELYAGGFFEAVGFALDTAFHIARWDGTSWSDVDVGVSDPVFALELFDDGGGVDLYVGGVFFAVGEPVPGPPLFTEGVARWDGAAWSDLDGGLLGFYAPPEVLSLAVWDDGGGDALFVGGFFELAGSGPVAVRNLAKWDGAAWSDVGGGTEAGVFVMQPFDDGGGEDLYLGGNFREAGGLGVPGIARWDGAAFSEVSVPGLNGMDSTVLAFATFDDGTGEALYAGGEFLTAGGVLAPGIAKWDGSSWMPLGDGIGCIDFGIGMRGFPLPPGAACFEPAVHALAVWDDGGGDALYVGGEFDIVDGLPIFNIAKWDGTTWSPLGVGLDGRVESLAVFDDGMGEALFIGGEFDADSAGIVMLSRIAKWDGTIFAPLGLGVDGDVEALAVFDDGGGEDLYAGGEFEMAGGAPAGYVARWDGAAWSTLGLGVDDEIEVLHVFDDGGGDDLYAGGDFTTAGGAPAAHIARWDGTAWSTLGVGLGDEAEAMTVYDDGTGPALFVGGLFFDAGGIPADLIAKWDGFSWSSLDGGLTSSFPFFDEPRFASVEALLPFDYGGGPSLFAGGFFTTAGGAVESTHIAEWRCALLDYGDAPDPYPTLLADDGARHDIVIGFHLGTIVEGDIDGQPSAMADGDGPDEDGVTFTSALVPGASADVDVEATAAGILDAWIDLDGSGSWDAGEKVFDGEALAAGVNNLTFAVPMSATAGDTFARFRFSSAGVSEPTGRAADGEVEDYPVTITAPAEISIDDVMLAEGDVGTTDFTFTVTRSHSLSDASVDVATADDTALAGIDYTAVPLTTLSFTEGGVLSMMVVVSVLTDTDEEAPQKDFFVNLSSPVAATLTDAQGVGSILDDDDTEAPSVLSVGSTDDTGDGVLAECEESRVPVRTLQVTFDQPVRDPAGDVDADDVTNPDNYRIFAAGADNDIESTTCAAPSGDDESLAISSVTYNSGTRTATVDPTAGALPDGPLRLVVCDSILDIAGNSLEGGDFNLNFRSERLNLLSNGQVDCDLSSWVTMSTNPAEIAYSSVDVDDASISGSAAVTNLTSSPDFSLGQCVEVVGERSYTLSGAVRVDVDLGAAVVLSRACEFFTSSDCSGAGGSMSLELLPLGDSAGSWDRFATELDAPVGAASALCSFDLSTPAGDSFDVWLDDLRLDGDGTLFTDGFESGNTTAWSNTSSR